MAEDILNKIYDPFFTTKEDGSGLGLSISYEIIKAHGGQIDFYNEPSGGLTCEIKLFRA
jgi:signal transduction histidine kinase